MKNGDNYVHFWFKNGNKWRCTKDEEYCPYAPRLYPKNKVMISKGRRRVVYLI